MPRWGKVGKQKIEDTGPLTKKRMETCDDEFVAAAKDFIKRAERGRQAVLRVAQHHAHAPVHAHQEGEPAARPGRWQSPYHDTMIDHDKNVGEMLDLLDELGIADDTFVMYSTDNGPHRNSWPDGGMTPFRSEKNTNWEGAFRIPLLVRWPGKIKAGSVANGIVQHHDWLPTFLAMAGAPDIVDKLKKGYKAIGRTYKNHIDGFNLLPYLTGKDEGEPAQAVRLHQRRRRHARRCATTTGRSCSWSSGCKGTLRRLGGAVHAAARCPRSSICAPIPTSSRTSPRTPTTIGSSTTPTSSVGAQAIAGKVRRDVQGLPADPEAEQLHHRRRDGEDGRDAAGGGTEQA